MKFSRSRTVVSAVASGAVALALSAGAAGTAAAAAPGHAGRAVPGRLAASDPLKVTPSKGLAGGDVVKVTASGITPSASVQVIQCREPDGDPADVCAPTLTTTASAAGRVSVKLTLADPVWLSQEIGDSIPVYCRADQCHVFLQWTDPDGDQQVLSSPRLWFKGAPATITASPATDLRNRQVVDVNGTAFGAAGHKFEVLEEACYAVSQGSGCYGQLPAVHGRIGKNGRYHVRYRARRYLAGGTDCNDPNLLGLCELTVIVFTKGQPDNSFGVSAIGQPLALITFSGSS
jgi:hypothetical protein